MIVNEHSTIDVTNNEQMTRLDTPMAPLTTCILRRRHVKTLLTDDEQKKKKRVIEYFSKIGGPLCIVSR